MAPPPSPTLPLQQRVLQLAQTLQFAWFVGHVTLLLCAVRYALSYITFNYNSKWALFSYRTAFIAAAATYGIVVFKSFRARARSGKPQGGALALAGDENVQYLGKSTCLLIMIRNVFTDQTLSNGSYLALLPSSPTCHFAFRRLLRIPRSNLHSLQPAANLPASATGPCRPEAASFCSCRYHW